MRPCSEESRSPSKTRFFCFSPPTRLFPFEWHCHDHFELVCVLGGHGLRFVGDHMGGYDGADLALIGPNLPHTYLSAPQPSGSSDQVVVVHFEDGFLRADQSSYQEFEAIDSLLAAARRGISFGEGATKEAGGMMLRLPNLEPFEQHVAVLRILHHLARSGSSTLLSSPGFKALRRMEDEVRVTRVCSEIHQRAREPVTLDQLAILAKMSPAAFSRFFKRATGRTFKRYLNEVRVETACRLLVMTELSVTEICYESGFQNVSNFNRRFLQIRSINPMEYRRQRRNAE